MTILFGSPIRQKPAVLREFLTGLDEANKGGCTISYCFVDDNTDPVSTQMLKQFAVSHDVFLLDGSQLLGRDTSSLYSTQSDTHYWDAASIDKIAFFKDYIIQFCIDHNYDYLFLVDSDIVLDKRVLPHLLKRNVDIVSNIFWSQWYPNWALSAQCFWMPEILNQVKTPFGKTMTEQEAAQMKRDFNAKLMIPGLYAVDGLGACTLISRNALEKGVCFKKIDNLHLQGEDRFFCVRANVLGISLFLDTVYPCYHIYREEYLDRVDEFKQEGFKFDMCQTFLIEEMPQKENILIRAAKKIYNKIKTKYLQYRNEKNAQRLVVNYNRKSHNETIVLQMPVHNECNRYLEEVLKSVSEFVDYYVIIDDASTDDTVALCETLLKDRPHVIIKNQKPLFQTEYLLRKKLWEETEKHNPGWILSLDADEVMPENAAFVIRSIIQNQSIDAYKFRLFDMWNASEYREDANWNAHTHFMPFLMRYSPNHIYHWKETNQHCGRFPLEISTLTYANIDLRVKHYGWAREEDRIAKYKRYLQLDPEGKDGSIAQYQSILDDSPSLKRFDDLPSEL